MSRHQLPPPKKLSKTCKGCGVGFRTTKNARLYCTTCKGDPSARVLLRGPLGEPRVEIPKAEPNPAVDTSSIKISKDLRTELRLQVRAQVEAIVQDEVRRAMAALAAPGAVQ